MAGKNGAESFRESKGVIVMQKILAVAVLGATLAFASGTAFAGDRRVVQPVAQATQPGVPGYNTGYSTVEQPSGPALQVQFPL